MSPLTTHTLIIHKLNVDPPSALRPGFFSLSSQRRSVQINVSVLSQSIQFGWWNIKKHAKLQVNPRSFVYGRSIERRTQSSSRGTLIRPDEYITTRNIYIPRAVKKRMENGCSIKIHRPKNQHYRFRNFILNSSKWEVVVEWMDVEE